MKGKSMILSEAMLAEVQASLIPTAHQLRYKALPYHYSSFQFNITAVWMRRATMR